jgi:purine nucleoside permease
MQNDVKPAARSLWGMLALIFGLMGYAFAIAAIGARIVDASLWLQTPFYLVAGILWIFPARKVLEWMGRGKR